MSPSIHARTILAQTVCAAPLPRDTPAIGLGCGDLYGTRDAREGSERLVRTAFDLGVRYFDVARLYGDGTAEAVLGRALKPVRDQVVIASKAGIVPWSMQTGRRIAHKAAKLMGPLKPKLNPPGERYGAFTTDELARSVDASLKALRIERIDILLLHECTPADAASPEVQSVMLGLVKAGKIGAWGVATHPAETQRIVTETPEAARVTQTASDAFEPRAQALQGHGRLVVTHSPIKRALPKLQAAWPEADVSLLARVLLRLAVRDNPGGIVLFSTSKPERLQSMLCEDVPDDLLAEASRRIGGLQAA